MADSKDQFHRIEDVKQRLYDRDSELTKRRREGVLHPVTHTVSGSWEAEGTDDMARKPRTSLFKKFFIGALIFFAIAALYGAYMYFKGSSAVSSDNIDINVLGNAFVEGGEELPLQIEIVNRNNANLELADVVVEYPRGATSDTNSDLVRLPRESIGTIGAGESVVLNKKVTLFGDQGTVRQVTVRLEYHPQGSNAIFTKEKSYPVTISSSPLSITIDAPTEVSTDQDITLTVTARLNTTLPQEKPLLELDYPSGFVFESAEPKASLNNSLWSLEGLTQTNPVTITVKGRIVGQEGDDKVFHAYVGTAKPNTNSAVDVVYNSLLHTVSITKPFLEARILVNGQDSEQYAITAGNPVRAEIEWANNLPNRITDAQISAHFSGNMFDKTSVSSTGGFYDSAISQIIWNRNTNSDLVSVEPGARGHVSFSFTPLAIIGSTESVRDPQVVVEISIKGRDASLGTGLSEVNNFERKVFRISSNFQIAASAQYVRGPLPPQAEKETTYMINWTLSNTANTITQAEARATLPTYVQWGGGTAGNSETVTFDQSTRQVVWKIGTVRPGTGFGAGNREVSFPVTLRPSLTQVGSVPQLIQEVALTGEDSFAQVKVNSRRQPLTTTLQGDPKFTPDADRVVK